MMTLFLDASFIVLLCFILFMTMALAYGYRKSIAALDQQIKTIKEILESSQLQLKHAEDRLASEQSIQNNLLKEIEALKKEANHQIQTIQDQSKSEMETYIDFRKATMDQMMDQIRLKTINDLKSTLSDQVQRVLENYLLNQLDAKGHESLNDHAIDQLEIALKPTMAKATGHGTDTQESRPFLAQEA